MSAVAPDANLNLDLDLDGRMMALARLLAARPDRVRLIDTDNRASQAEWRDRPPGHPFAVYLARGGRFRTLALDFDAKWATPERAAGDAAIAAGLLRGFGVPAVVVASGPTGGRHVLATVTGRGLAAGEARRLVEALRRLPLPSLDPPPMLNPQTGCIRPPLSRHRLGGRSRLLDDQVSALAALATGAPPYRYRTLLRALPDLDPARRRPLRRPRSDGSVAELLHPGPRPSRYVSDSEAVQALATSYVARGRSFAEFFAALTTAHSASSVGRAHAHRRATADEWARRSWATAVRFVRAHPARPSEDEPDDQDVLDAWRAALATVRLSKSARRAAEALHAMAGEHRRVLVGLGVRDLAERIGVGLGTASQALRQLRAAGLIEVAGAAVAGRATRHRLRHPDEWCADIFRTIGPYIDRGGVNEPTVRGVSAAALALAGDLGHDLWRHRGLGETCRRTYLALAQHFDRGGGSGMTVADVAQATGVSVRQARRNLARLAEHGLARRDLDGRWSVEERDGEAVANAVGTAGTGRKQRSRHATERRDWRLRRTLRRAASSKPSSADRTPGPAESVVSTAPAASPTAGQFSRAAPQQNSLIASTPERRGRGTGMTGPAVAGGAASGIGAPAGINATPGATVARFPSHRGFDPRHTPAHVVDNPAEIA